MKDQIDADCIVLGSSRALNQIVPAILDSALSVRSYNLGMAGAHIDDVWARYQLYRLRNKAPKVAIICLDYFTITKNAGTNMDQFYPWFFDPDFRRIVFPVMSFSWAEKYIPFFRYKGIRTDFVKNEYAPLEKGFLGLDYSWRGDQLEKSSFYFKVNPNIESYFFELLDQMEKEDVFVILITTPLYLSALNKRKNPEEMSDYYQKISSRRGIPYIDYEQVPLSMDTSFFFNAGHLNRRGAELFTDTLVSDIKKMEIFK